MLEDNGTIALRFERKLFSTKNSQLNYQPNVGTQYRPFQTYKESKYDHPYALPEEITWGYTRTKPEENQAKGQ